MANIHDGPTGQAIREEKNLKINPPRLERYRKMARKQQKLSRFPRLKHAPNPYAHRMALWRSLKGLIPGERDLADPKPIESGF